jgi:hypothetical protein
MLINAIIRKRVLYGINITFVLPFLLQFTHIARSCELDHPVANLEDIKMNCNVKEKTFNIQLFKKLYFDWSTSCHMCIIQAIEDVKEMNNKISKFLFSK